MKTHVWLVLRCRQKIRSKNICIEIFSSRRNEIFLKQIFIPHPHILLVMHLFILLVSLKKWTIICINEIFPKEFCKFTFVRQFNNNFAFHWDRWTPTTILKQLSITYIIPYLKNNFHLHLIHHTQRAFCSLIFNFWNGLTNLSALSTPKPLTHSSHKHTFYTRHRTTAIAQDI